MKILYIDVNCKNSSTGQIVYSLFSNCKKNGIDAAICYGRGPLIKEDGIYKFGLDWETRLHAILTRITGYMGKYSYFSTKRLIKYIKTFKPDIVHIHELHSYFVNIKTILMYLKRNNIITVITNHCEFLYTGKCGYAKECEKYRMNCGGCPELKEYPKSLFFDRTSQMLNEKKKIFEDWESVTLVSPSQWIKKRMSSSFLSKNQVKVIYNGIDVSQYYFIQENKVRSKYNIPPNNKIVLTIAYDVFSERKGGITFTEIARKMNDCNVTFIAVGDVSGVYDGGISNLICLPLINNKDELINLYSSADCFLICSKYENFPTTSLEAQCCGCKIVGFDIGGVKETILKDNGFITPLNDIEGAKECIIKILDENYSKEEVSKKAKEYFSSKRMFDEYSEIYNKLCS